MTYILSILILILVFALMAVGLIFAKKVLKKGCSLGPDCSCKTKNISPEDCDNPNR